MVVCSFFQQGRCKFGERCKNEHPGQSTVGSSNRFGALAGGGFGGHQASQAQQPVNYGITVTDVKVDLTAGKGLPEWIFSSYGPGRNAPRQLFGGPQREQSFEELRLRHYEAAAAGNAEVAVQEAQALYAESMKQIDVALNDLDGAVKYILDGINEHPNRIDITEGKTGPAAGQASSAFGQPSPFGQPAVTPQATAPQPATLGGSGGQSAFGQPSTFGQPSAFGQSSTLGQTSGFGQPSTLGQSSAFGTPSALGGQSAFGKSAFGQPGFGQPAFGQPSAPSTSAFGQPTAASPFSQLSGQNQGSGSGFGQPSGMTTASPFAQAAAGQQPGAPTGFGQLSAAQPSATPFGQPSQAASPFGNPSAPAAPAAPAAPFGQPATAPSPFGATSQPTAPSPFGHASGGFAQAAPAAPTPVIAGPTATAGTGPPPAIKIDDPQDLKPIPPLSGQTVQDPMTKRISMWKGQPVKYIDNHPCYLHPQDRQTYVRIFFPNGPPDQASLKDAQGKPEEYTPEVTEQYEFFVKNGYFKDGIIPSIPPKTEWVSFDF